MSMYEVESVSTSTVCLSTSVRSRVLRSVSAVLVVALTRGGAVCVLALTAITWDPSFHHRLVLQMTKQETTTTDNHLFVQTLMFVKCSVFISVFPLELLEGLSSLCYSLINL